VDKVHIVKDSKKTGTLTKHAESTCLRMEGYIACSKFWSVTLKRRYLRHLHIQIDGRITVKCMSDK